MKEVDRKECGPERIVKCGRLRSNDTGARITGMDEDTNGIG